MTTATAAAPEVRLITHKDLPEDDGTVPTSFLERPQTSLLTGAMMPCLRRRFPDGKFAVGADSLIYWRLTHPPTRGARAPDWFLVLGVEPMLNGEVRRSYVMWDEVIAPLLVVEYVSGDGSEEHDRSPYEGKFWVYEKGIKAAYYAIHDGFRGTLELHRRNGDEYHAVPPNERGRFPIPELGVELGLWQGTVDGIVGWYVRPWESATGEMLPSYDDDRARLGEAESLTDDLRRELAEEAEQTQQARRAEEQARQQAEQARRAEDEAKQQAEEARRAEEEARRAEEEARRAEEESRKQADEARQKAERLAARLRELGIDPEAA